jgi:hypothetical protein
MTDQEKQRNIEIEFISTRRTILRSDLCEGDCIGFPARENGTGTRLQVGIIKSFIADSTNQKATVVLMDGRHIPLNWIRHRIKSNQIELTK